MIQVLGAPFDFGQPHKGVVKAYRHLKNQGLFKALRNFTSVTDLGEIPFAHRELHLGVQKINFSKGASLASKLISQKIEDLNLQDSFLLNIGGDHGMALGTVHGILSHSPDAVIVWADAHGDINTPESSLSGNFHGMPLSFLLQEARHPDFEWMDRFIRPEKLILIGPRDLDPGEKEIISKLSIQYFSSTDLNSYGAKEVLAMELHRADPFGNSPIHFSFDVDVFDRKDFGSTGTTVPDGPNLEEIFLLGGLLAQTGRLRSMDLVEFNPELGDISDVLASTELTIEFLELIAKEVSRQHCSEFLEGPFFSFSHEVRSSQVS